MLMQPALGALSGWIGRKPLLRAFGVIGTLRGVPIMAALSRIHDAGIAFALLVIVSGPTSVNSVMKSALFPASVRRAA